MNNNNNFCGSDVTASKSNNKVLLVDDSQTQLRSLSLMLSKAGYQVITATNGTEGIQAAYDQMPALIISDIIMPDIDGYQLCRLLKNDSHTRTIPIILLTNLNERMDKFWGLRSGADAFISKFGEFDALVNEVEKLIRQSENSETTKCHSYNADERSNSSSDIQHRIKSIIDQSLIESTIINEFRHLSERISNIDELNKGIFNTLSSILDYHVAGIFYNDRDEKKLKNLHLSICDVALSEYNLRAIEQEVFMGIFRDKNAAASDTHKYEIFESHCSIPKAITDCQNFQSKIILPMVYDSKVIGGICLFHTDPCKYTPSQNSLIRILDIVLQEVKILMKIKWLYSETKYLAITDGLTGLYNRRYFQQSLEREFERAKRQKVNLSLLMVDIDKFKNINDTYGHQFGDKVIAEVSKIVKASLRRTDYVARYGGEEIVAILPDTSLDRAVVPIERLRAMVENTPFMYGDKNVKVTISAGIAGFSSDMATEKELVEHADRALYVAKESGRNRVELFCS